MSPPEEGVDAVFSALADPTRRHLVESLAAQPGVTATGLAATLPISRQAVTKHLRRLERARLVSSSRRGREALYELDLAPLAEAAEWMEAVGAEWDGQLARLRALLEKG